MAKKKVVMVIVEGISDEIALEGSLRNIYQGKEVKFKVVRSDITSDRDSTGRNIKIKVSELIKSEMSRSSLEREDILKVIHIIDMDGAYISENAIEESLECQGFKYSETKIIAKDKDRVIERNKRKSKNINILSCLDKINRSLDYVLYYFSCNQEHVLGNLIDAPDNRKNKLAEEFNDRYEDDFQAFIEFISDEIFAVKGEYSETWEFVKKDNNSLKRFSNFHLLLKDREI
ncbi:MAG: hypothetical protein ACRC6E_02330 [Fusobacteriaceae bacterium]